MFIKEKEVQLQQELHANLLIGYYVTSDTQIRKFNPVAKLHKLVQQKMRQTKKKTCNLKWNCIRKT